jgi:hypothetical protein
MERRQELGGKDSKEDLSSSHKKVQLERKVKKNKQVLV